MIQKTVKCKNKKCREVYCFFPDTVMYMGCPKCGELEYKELIVEDVDFRSWFDKYTWRDRLKVKVYVWTPLWLHVLRYRVYCFITSHIQRFKKGEKP